MFIDVKTDISPECRERYKLPYSISKLVVAFHAINDVQTSNK